MYFQGEVHIKINIGADRSSFSGHFSGPSACDWRWDSSFRRDNPCLALFLFQVI
jgi:hypothetical protein